MEVAGVLWDRIRFGRVGGGKLPFDGGEVHGILDNRRVVGYVERDGINRP
jgi:hypothetical protein